MLFLFFATFTWVRLDPNTDINQDTLKNTHTHTHTPACLPSKTNETKLELRTASIRQTTTHPSLRRVASPCMQQYGWGLLHLLGSCGHDHATVHAWCKHGGPSSHSAPPWMGGGGQQQQHNNKTLKYMGRHKYMGACVATA